MRPHCQRSTAVGIVGAAGYNRRRQGGGRFSAQGLQPKSAKQDTPVCTLQPSDAADECPPHRCVSWRSWPARASVHSTGTHVRCRNRTTVPSRYSQCLASGLHAWRWARSCMLQPVSVSLRAKCFRLPHQALEFNSGAMVQQRPPAKGSTVQHSMCAPFHNTPTYVAPGSLHPGPWPAINVPKFLVGGHDTLQMRM